MTTVYQKIRAEASRTRRPESRAADIVVVGLGSNDFGKLREGEEWADEEALRADFEAALLGFMRGLREDNRSVLLILLAFGEYGEALMGAHRAAFEALRADGARVQLVILPELERDACDWHPSLADHAMIADRLIAAIGKEPGAWKGSASTP
jgi:hypothetical protein